MDLVQFEKVAQRLDDVVDVVDAVVLHAVSEEHMRLRVDKTFHQQFH